MLACFFLLFFFFSQCSKLDGGAVGSSAPSEPSASDDTASFHTGAERGRADNRSSVPLRWRGGGRREWTYVGAGGRRDGWGGGYPFFFQRSIQVSGATWEWDLLAGEVAGRALAAAQLPGSA